LLQNFRILVKSKFTLAENHNKQKTYKE